MVGRLIQTALATLAALSASGCRSKMDVHVKAASKLAPAVAAGPTGTVETAPPGAKLRYEHAVFQSSEVVTLVLPPELASGDDVLVTNLTSGSVVSIKPLRLTGEAMQTLDGSDLESPLVLQIIPWMKAYSHFLRPGDNLLSLQTAANDGVMIQRTIKVLDFTIHGSLGFVSSTQALARGAAFWPTVGLGGPAEVNGGALLLGGVDDIITR